MQKLPPDVELLGMVGTALSQWSMVEMQMYLLFDAIANIRNKDQSRALYDGILSFEVRIGILDRMMALDGADTLETEMWIRMSARLKKFYKKRHALAHFAVVTDGEDYGIAPFMTWDTLVRKANHHLFFDQVRERAEKFIEIYHALPWFIERARARHMPVGIDPPQMTPDTSLIVHIRDLATQMLARNLESPTRGAS